MTELVLGTAQFGVGYGVTNKVGYIPDDVLVGILGVARAAGINLFDTAPDYGDAQSRLGSLGADVPRHFVSKFRLPENDDVSGSKVSLAATLTALGVNELYGMLFHRVEDLRDPRATDAWKQLGAARESGVVARIGASIYDVADLEVVVERFPDLNLIQIPANVFDQRLLNHPVLRALHDRGVEVHVRSAYLQGVLLAPPEELPDFFDGVRPSISRLRAAASEQGASVISAVLGFLKNSTVVDAVLVGATSADELRSTVDAWQSASPDFLFPEFPELPAELLDPRSWPPRRGGK